MLRILRPILRVAFLWVVAMAVVAQPAQKIIVQFKNPLTEEQQHLFLTSITSLLPSFAATGADHKIDHFSHELEKLEQSTDSRWILRIHPVVSEEELKSLIEKIEKIDSVQFAEQDRLLKSMQL